MIDKEKLKQVLIDNCQYGLYDNDPFYIIPSWQLIRQCNLIQGIDSDDTYHKDNNQVLNFEYLLGIIETDYNYPILESDILQWIKDLEIRTLIDNGQLSLFPIWQDFETETSIKIKSELIKVYQDNIDNDPIYWVNDYITDNIPQVEWGFDDEYQLCDNCYQIVLRTSPDSYMWVADYYQDNDGYKYCKSCAEDMLEDNIQDIQLAIDNDEQPKSLSWIFDLDDNWHIIPNKSAHGYQFRWENGLHHGMNDDPLRQGKIIRKIKINNDPIFDVCFRIYPSQFYVEWDTFIRINPDINVSIDVNDYLDNFTEAFKSSEGRFPYDLADLMSKALQNVNYPYSTITVNPDNGDINITGTNDINEYFNNK